MKRMMIDFAPFSFWRSIRNAHPIALALIMATLFTIVCIAIVVLDQHYYKKRLTTEKQALLVKLDMNGLYSKKNQHDISAQQAEAVNKAIAQLNLPWNQLFNTLESLSPSNVALLSLEPQARSMLLKGIAEAKDADAMLDYLERLERQSFFTNVVLTRHEINDKDPYRPVRFYFEAQWKGVS